MRIIDYKFRSRDLICSNSMGRLLLFVSSETHHAVSRVRPSRTLEHVRLGAPTSPTSTPLLVVIRTSS
jgi:hypothetical protein